MRDETGGRRFWPVAVGKIDLDKLAADREQIFAEAVVAYRSGVKWWPDRDFEATVIKPEQEARFEDDAWVEPIEQWLSDREQATIAEIAEGALHFHKSKIGTADPRRIAQILDRLGWERGKRTEMGRPWVRKALTHDAHDALSPTDELAADAGKGTHRKNASCASCASSDFTPPGEPELAEPATDGTCLDEQEAIIAAATFAIWGLWLHRLESLCVNTHYIEETLGVLTHNPPQKPRQLLDEPAARPKPRAIALAEGRHDRPRQLLEKPAARLADLALVKAEGNA